MMPLQRIKSPELLRMEFHTQGGEILSGESVEVSMISKRTGLFALYSFEALFDFCAWMCLIGDFEFTNRGYILSPKGWEYHRKLRSKLGRPTLPLSVSQKEDSNFQNLRREFYLRGQKMKFGDVFPLSALASRVPSLEGVSESAMKLFVEQLCKVGDMVQCAPPVDFLYAITLSGLQFQRQLHQQEQLNQKKLEEISPEEFIRQVSNGKFEVAEQFLMALHEKKGGKPFGGASVIKLFGEVYGWDAVDLEDFGRHCLEACLCSKLVEFQNEIEPFGYHVSAQILHHLGIDPPPPMLVVDLDELADLLLEESTPIIPTAIPKKGPRSRFRFKKVVVETSQFNSDVENICRITHAISLNLESMLADLRACFG